MIAINRHHRQLKNQRRYMKQRERDLPRRCDRVSYSHLPRRSTDNFHVIVWEDFVSLYLKDGKKVNNLVLTIIWRDEQGVLQEKHVDNICTDHSKKCDSFFVRAVWKFHLCERGQRSKELEGVTHIIRTGFLDHSHMTDILSGDSGGHFHSRVTMLFESMAQHHFNVKWETHTQCKRHAYGPCDAHGGVTKKRTRRAQVRGERLQSEGDVASLYNRDGYFVNTR